MPQSIAANTQDPREHVRSNVFLSASLVVGARSIPVRVRNISAMGALLDGNSFPAEGTSVQLKRGDLRSIGAVAWQTAGNCGVRFAALIDVEPWIRRVEHSGQRKVDNVIAALRMGKLPERETEMSDGGLIKISEELTRISTDLVELPEMRIEFAEQLLRLDAVAQRLRQWVTELD